MKSSRQSQHPALILIPVLVMATGAAFLPLRLQADDEQSAAKQRTFASPEEAVQALTDATKAADHAALHEIFGPGQADLVTGDKVEDEANFARFSKALAQMCNPAREGDDKVILNIGAENWPFPIPLVKKEARWFFDTDAGKEEIINRHVGDDELNTIGVCRTYVAAQRQYASKDRDGSEVFKYAQKFKSAPGKKDGLYWEATADEDSSPFGPLVAEARDEGYGPRKAGEAPHPFHGYVFRILTSQGPAAPGGQYNYIINGNMIAGFAMVAYPDKWGDSGVMTFTINQQGKLYQKDLGLKTEEIARAMTEYNPDKSWTPVTELDTATK
jgi:hypothetical protein